MSSTDRRYLILHGWQNHRPSDHWQAWLTRGLVDDGFPVQYPQFPSADEPRYEEWVQLLRAELRLMGGRERIVVCHSLSCVLWMLAASRGEVPEPVDRLLLVAPPGAERFGEPVATFAPAGLDADAVRASCRAPVRLVYSDGDPYCLAGAGVEYGAPLALDLDPIPNAGHISLDEGYGPWPAVAAWCRDPTVRFSDGAG